MATRALAAYATSDDPQPPIGAMPYTYSAFVGKIIRDECLPSGRELTQNVYRSINALLCAIFFQRRGDDRIVNEYTGRNLPDHRRDYGSRPGRL